MINNDRNKNPDTLPEIGYRLLFPISLAYTITVASGGSQPDIQIPTWIPSFDKIAHFFVFGLLATLFCRYRKLNRMNVYQGVFAIICTTLFGLSDELHQFSNPERFFEIADWIADTLGAIVAIIVYQNWHKYQILMELQILNISNLSMNQKSLTPIKT